MTETQVVDFYDVGDEDEYDEDVDNAPHVERIPCAKLIWKGESYNLFQGDNLIGRDDVCEVTLDHKSISAKHAEISISEDRVAIIRDLRSANGTFVEHPVEGGQFQRLSVAHNRKELHHGMKVRFGMVCCEFSFQMEPQPSTNGAETQMFGEQNNLVGVETQFLPDMDVDPENSVASYHTAVAIPDPPPTVQTSGAPSVRFFPTSNSPVRSILPREPSYGQETATMVDNATQLLLDAKVSPHSHHHAVEGGGQGGRGTSIQPQPSGKEDKSVSIPAPVLPGVRSTRVAERVVVGATPNPFGSSGIGHDVPTQVDQELLRNTLRMASENDDEDEDEDDNEKQSVNVIDNTRRVVVGSLLASGVVNPPIEEATLLLDEDQVHGHTGHGRVADPPVTAVKGGDDDHDGNVNDEEGEEDGDDADDQSQDIMQVDDADAENDAEWLPSKAMDPLRVVSAPTDERIAGFALTKSNTLMEGDTDDDDEPLPDTHVSTSTGSRSGTIPREESTYLSTAVNSPQPSPMKHPRPEGISTAVPTPDVTRTAVQTPVEREETRSKDNQSVSSTAVDNGPDQSSITEQVAVVAGTSMTKEEVPTPTTPASHRRGGRHNGVDATVVASTSGSESVRQSRRKGKRSASPAETVDAPTNPSATVAGAVDAPGASPQTEAIEEKSVDDGPSELKAADNLPPRKRSRRGPAAEADVTPVVAATAIAAAATPAKTAASEPLSSTRGRATRRKRPHTDGDEDGEAADVAPHAVPHAKDDTGDHVSEAVNVASSAQETETAVVKEEAAVPSSSTGRPSRSRKVAIAGSREEPLENGGDGAAGGNETATTGRSSLRTAAKRTSPLPSTTASEEPTVAAVTPEPSTVRSRRPLKQARLQGSEEPPSAVAASATATAATAVAPSSSSSSSTSSTAVNGAANNDNDNDNDDDDGIVLMFTKLEESAFQRYLRRLPQIRVTNDAREATHVLTTPELKRTPKLLVALNHRVLFVVTEAWLIDSAKQQKPLPLLPETVQKRTSTKESTYRDALQSCRYLVHDADKEDLWQFRLVDTLTRIRFHPAATRRIFGHVTFFVTRGLMGETAPSVDDMRAIVESGGGILCDDLATFWQVHDGDEGEDTTTVGTSSRRSTKSQRGSSQSRSTASRSSTGSSALSSSTGDFHETAAAAETLRGRTLVVVSHPSVVKKEIPRDLLQRLRRQATATLSAATTNLDTVIPGGRVAPGVYSLEVLYRAVLRQELNLDVHQLDGFTFR